MSEPGFLQLSNEESIRASSEGSPPTGAEQRLHEERNPFSFTPLTLRLHKHHELFEEGDIRRHLYLQDLYISQAEDRKSPSVSEFACHISGCHAHFTTLSEYEHHYNSLHRNVCCSCHRSLPTARLLDIHIQEWHDSLFAVLAQKQDMYLCLVEGCGQKFSTGKQRKEHLIRIHKYPPDFRFDKPKKAKRVGEASGPYQKDTNPEAISDVCMSEGVCEAVCTPMTDQPEQESMEMNICEEDATNKGDLTDVPQSSEFNAPSLKPHNAYRVPKTVCFGHGSSRSFRGQRGKRK